MRRVSRTLATVLLTCAACLSQPAAAAEDGLTTAAAAAPDLEEANPLLPVPPGGAVLFAGRAVDLVGRPMYADRRGEGTSGLEVRFSDRPIVRAPALAAGSMYRAGLPLRGARVSSGYGYRYHPITGSWRMHGGVDLAASAGTPVPATSAGVVARAGWSGGYGLLVELDHGAGVRTRYAHLSRVDVRPGEAITPGQRIGLVGSTGNSTGAHLHFETRVNGRPARPGSPR